MWRKTKTFNSDMLIVKWKNKTVIVASLIVLTRANGNGFSKDIFYFPCSLEINNMCSGYCHFLPEMFWILAGLCSLPVFSQSVAMDWTNRYILDLIITEFLQTCPCQYQIHITNIFPWQVVIHWVWTDVSVATIQAHKIYTSSITSTFCICYCGKRTKCSHSICEGYPGTA